MLSRDEIIEILGANREGLRRDFGVESMALFGSVARGDAGPLSDVDVLVEIPKPISLFELVAAARAVDRAEGRRRPSRCDLSAAS